MISIDGMYNSDNPRYIDVDKITEGFASSPWNSKIKKVSGMLDIILNILLAVVGIVSVIALIFQKNEISLNYYYRRKEIGALKLFGIKKSRIYLFLLSERLISCLISLVIGTIAFTLVCTIIYWIENIYLFVSITNYILVVLLFVFYNTIIVLISSKKLVNREILKLLK